MTPQEMEEPGVRWADLLPGMLAEVIKRLPLKDRLITVPQVCKSWRTASFDPVCWQCVNIKDWCYDRSGEDIDRMVRLAADRSAGCMQELHVTNLSSDACLGYLAERGLSSLKTLCMPGCTITHEALCGVVRTAPGLVRLDISSCSSIRGNSLEVIGKACKYLTWLDKSAWVMSPDTLGPSDDSDAIAIAENMPKLKRLDLVANILSNVGLTAILDQCPLLEHLDIRFCRNVNLDGPIQVRCSKLPNFRASSVDDEYYEDELDEDYYEEYYDDEDPDWEYWGEMQEADYLDELDIFEEHVENLDHIFHLVEDLENLGEAGEAVDLDNEGEADDIDNEEEEGDVYDLDNMDQADQDNTDDVYNWGSDDTVDDDDDF